jgi:replicative DNA helicase
MDRYPYDEEFQESLLALMVRDSSFLIQNLDVLNPNYFESETHRIVAKIVVEYAGQYKRTPTRVSLRNLIQDYAIVMNYGEDWVGDLTTKVEELYNVELSDGSYLREKVSKFGRTQSVKVALLQTIDLMKNDGDLDEAQRLLLRSFSAGSQSGNLGYNFHEKPREVLKEILASTHYDLKRKVSTGFPTLDNYMWGGLGGGEVCMWVAGTGKGKSIMLTNLGASAVLASKKAVVEYSLELDEDDMKLRYLSRLTGTRVYDLLAKKLDKDYERQMNALESMKYYLKLVHFSPRSIGVNGIRSHLTKLMILDEVEIGLLIIDYLDLLRPSSPKMDPYEALGETTLELCALAQDLKIPIHTASQVNRGGSTKAILGLEDVGDSWKKVENADVVLTLASSKKEFEQGFIRIGAPKIRRMRDRFPDIVCHAEYERMLIRESSKKREVKKSV